MQSERYPVMEQASAVRDLYKGAEEAYFFVAELQGEVLDHGRNALAFLRAWAQDPDADPTQIRESFARMEMVHRQLGGVLDVQRRALEVMPARLVLAPGADPEREERARRLTLIQLELEGALGGHRSGLEPRGRPRLDPDDHLNAGLEE